MIQAHSSGVQVSLFPDIQDVYLSYRDYTMINDAQWHHIAIVWDGENGGELKLITEGLIATKVDNYGSGRKLPEQYVFIHPPNISHYLIIFSLKFKCLGDAW